ncbi:MULTISPECIES: DUF4270 family protein [unclassified Siphonobacter]|uniref:DUF4270 family protein n=1 Tax=unclassified Siphonobacter TaxID=2635712 RepID=UPI000CB1FAC5|nr:MULTISPECIES: DUF4270 family protein [unclassified Siphonobacter]MDQ1088200.1 hypothetical protein [Siphonobacter sp. SORGH_AS_1065]MDR6194346.1 hypothetical protein [Siphonobacter sp. SORGH_AS_0500]PKK37648.1 hypothetical protein BWI96_04040 [Siphonobacter sp. SORGH_AS_0500]
MKNRKSWLLLCFVASLLYVLGSCQKGDLNLGSEVIPDANLSVVMVDTFTVKLSTVAVTDTAITSADSMIYAGRWRDANTGVQEFTAFASPTFPSNTLNTRASSIVLDSTVLILPLSYSYGDSVQTFKLSAHVMTTPLASGTLYYNTNTSARYATQPLAEKSFYPGKGGTPTVRIRKDSLGAILFDRLKTRTIRDDETLQQVLPGLAFKGSSAGNVIVGFGVNTGRSLIRLYFHDNSSTTVTSEKIDIDFSYKHYTRYGFDYKGTPLANLKNRSDAVNSSLTGNVAYITQGGPLRTRVEFPYFDNVLMSRDAILGVNRAELIFDPVRTNFRDNALPPNTLYLYKTNAVNDILTSQPIETITNSLTPVSATYTTESSIYETKDHYTFNVTNYFNQLMSGKTQLAPIILTPGVGAQQYLNFSRTSLGNRNYSSDRVRLVLYYTNRNR